MTTETKKNLATISIYIMMATIAVIVIWFIGFIVSVTFGLNVLNERTSTFAYALLGAAFVIVGCAAFLNISLNISVIADGHVAANSNASRVNYRVAWIGTGGVIAAVVIFLFAGDYISRENEKKGLQADAAGVVSRYSASINNIPEMLIDSAKVNEIPPLLNILSNQKESFNEVSVITFAELDGQPIFLEITRFNTYKKLQKPFYDNSFYKCREEDAEYLTEVFAGKRTSPYLWSEKSDYQLYIPVTNDGKVFVLSFTKRNRYGSIGS